MADVGWQLTPGNQALDFISVLPRLYMSGIVGYVLFTLTYHVSHMSKSYQAIILCKLNKSLLESSKSVGIHRQKSLYSLKNLCI